MREASRARGAADADTHRRLRIIASLSLPPGVAEMAVALAAWNSEQVASAVLFAGGGLTAVVGLVASFHAAAIVRGKSAFARHIGAAVYSVPLFPQGAAFVSAPLLGLHGGLMYAAEASQLVGVVGVAAWVGALIGYRVLRGRDDNSSASSGDEESQR